METRQALRKKNLLPDGTPAQCNPDGPLGHKQAGPCCSKNGREIIERRHGEPIKFLFLPKMGLLGSQAGNEKKFWL